jgi:hypothetical protein
MWTVVLLLFRRVLRSDILAVGVMAVLTVGIAPTTQWTAVVALVIANIVGLLVALRIGFLGLISHVVVGQVMIALPFSPGAPGVVGALSWMSLAAVVVPSGVALYTSLAGQSIFGDAED